MLKIRGMMTLTLNMSSVTFKKCSFTNQLDRQTLVVKTRYSNLTLTDCIFMQNFASKVNKLI